MILYDSSGRPKTYKRWPWSKIWDAMVGSSVADGDLLVRSGGVWTRKAIGTEGQYLKMVSSAPAWADSAGGAGGIGLYSFKRQTSTVTATNATTGTTYQDISHSTVTLDVGTYRFEIKNFCTSVGSTPGLRQRLHFTGTAGWINYNDSFIIEGNTSYFNANETALDVAAAYTSTGRMTTTYRGTINVTASGTFSYQAAQANASATSVDLSQLGSYSVFWQLA